MCTIQTRVASKISRIDNDFLKFLFLFPPNIFLLHVYIYLYTQAFLYVFTLCVKTAVLFYSPFIPVATETIMSQILTIQHQEYSQNH